MSDISYAEKLERVYREFEQSLDIDIAFVINDITDADKKKIEADPLFIARVNLCLAREKQSLVRTLKDLAFSADSESVKLSALKELGRTLYPRRFSERSGDDQSEAAKRYAEITAILTARTSQ